MLAQESVFNDSRNIDLWTPLYFTKKGMKFTGTLSFITCDLFGLIPFSTQPAFYIPVSNMAKYRDQEFIIEIWIHGASNFLFIPVSNMVKYSGQEFIIEICIHGASKCAFYYSYLLCYLNWLQQLNVHFSPRV